MAFDFHLSVVLKNIVVGCIYFAFLGPCVLVSVSSDILFLLSSCFLSSTSVFSSSFN